MSGRSALQRQRKLKKYGIRSILGAVSAEPRRPSRSKQLALLGAALGVLATASASAAPRSAVWSRPGAPAKAPGGLGWLTQSGDALNPLTPSSWLLSDMGSGHGYRMSGEQELSLLRRYREPSVERISDWQSFYRGRFGPRAYAAVSRLAWSAVSCEPEAVVAGGLFPNQALPRWASLAPISLATPAVAGLGLMPTWAAAPAPAPELGALGPAPAERCEPGQRAYEVTLAGFGGEVERFALLECDGSIAIDALDRLSVLARPPGTPRPALPLPIEPAPEQEVAGEWLPSLRMLEPRLAWVLASIAEMFPGRVVYIISGYRRDAHDGYHKKGRALDLLVMGVPNEDVFRACRRLRDVGCGFYPHNKFVHVDVRPAGTGRAMWIDASRPGEPSRYVDSWPGVVASGALSWVPSD